MIKAFVKILVDDILIRFLAIFIKNKQHNKLLIIRKDGIGDLILFLPTIKYYKTLFPEKEITLMLPTAAQEFKDRIKFIDKVTIFCPKKFKKNILYRIKFILNIKRSGFDTIVYPVFSREKIVDYIISIAKPKDSFGIHGDSSNMSEDELAKGDRFYTNIINISNSSQNEIEHNFEFISWLGAKNITHELPLILTNKEDDEEANKIMLNANIKNKFFFVVAPGSGLKFKEWPVEKFIETLNTIDTNIIPVIIGGPKEESIAKLIQSSVNKKTINLTGKTSIFVLASLIKRAKFYLGNDTGPMHIAAAVGTPVICIMGVGHFGRFFPYGDLNKNRIVYDKRTKLYGDHWKSVLNFNKPAEYISSIPTKDVINEVYSLITYLNQNEQRTDN